MAKGVWKFTISAINETIAFSMPENAEVLFVREQRGVPCMWCRVDTSLPHEIREFTLVGTGHPAPDGPYRGSFFINEGQFVFHLFEVVK